MNVHFKKLSKKQLIIVIVAAVLLIVVAATGISCAVRDETPQQLLQDVFVSDEDQLVGKWLGEKAANAYEFYEDGTYDSYISTFSVKGNYVVSGKEITLTMPGASGSDVYRYSISGDTLTLTLVKTNNQEVANKEQHTYTRVEYINTKTLTELLQDFADEVKEEDDGEETTAEEQE